MKRFSHLTLSDRIVIEKCLTGGASFKHIAEELEKHPTTIANEVKKHLQHRKTGGAGQPFNDCLHRCGCTKENICGGRGGCFKRYCRMCARCREYCPDYERQICPQLQKAPYVCSGCRSRRLCPLEKAVYDAAAANDEAAVTLHESRSGIHADESEIMRLNEIITKGIKQGQSLYHIWQSEKEKSPMPSLRTLCSHVEKKVLGISNIDLPRKVKYRPGTQKGAYRKADGACKAGRSYEDFRKYMQEHPDAPLVQMDSVIGSSGRKTLLTLHFTASHLMPAYLREDKKASGVQHIFDMLMKKPGRETFHLLFPVILTDNGTEFSDPAKLEKLSDGTVRTKIFYCMPNSPYQKGAIENNHSLIRRILPNGVSFDGLNQEQIERMMDNINSYKREKLNGHTPYDTFSFLYGEEILLALGSQRVEAEKVILKPSLLFNK